MRIAATPAARTTARPAWRTLAGLLGELFLAPRLFTPFPLPPPKREAEPPGSSEPE